MCVFGGGLASLGVRKIELLCISRDFKLNVERDNYRDGRVWDVVRHAIRTKYR